MDDIVTCSSAIDSKMGLTTLEQDFQFNIVLLAERDKVIEMYRSFFKQLCVILINDTSIIKHPQIMDLFRKILKCKNFCTIEPLQTLFNDILCQDSTHHSDPPYDVKPESDFNQNGSNVNCSTKLDTEFIDKCTQVSDSELCTKNGIITEMHGGPYASLSQQIGNKEISHCNSENTDRHKSLFEDVKDQTISTLLNNFSIKKSIYYSYSKERERMITDAKRKLSQTQDGLFEEIIHLKKVISKAKLESFRVQYFNRKSFTSILSKYFYLTRILIACKNFILHQKIFFSKSLISKQCQINQLNADLKEKQDQMSINCLELEAMENRLLRSKTQGLDLERAGRQLALDLQHEFDEQTMFFNSFDKRRLSDICTKFSTVIKEWKHDLSYLEQKFDLLKYFTCETVYAIKHHSCVENEKNTRLQKNISNLMEENNLLKNQIKELKLYQPDPISSHAQAFVPDIPYPDTFVSHRDSILSRLSLRNMHNPGDENKSEIFNLDFFDVLQSQIEEQLKNTKHILFLMNNLESKLNRDYVVTCMYEQGIFLKSISAYMNHIKQLIHSHQYPQFFSKTYLKQIVDRIKSLVKEKKIILEANHRLRTENNAIKMLHRSPNESQVAKPATILNSSGNGSCFGKISPVMPRGVSMHVPRETVDTTQRDSSVHFANQSSPELVINSGAVSCSFNLSTEFPGWYNDSDFQKALYYADNQGDIDKEFP